MLHCLSVEGRPPRCYFGLKRIGLGTSGKCTVTPRLGFRRRYPTLSTFRRWNDLPQGHLVSLGLWWRLSTIRGLKFALKLMIIKVSALYRQRPPLTNTTSKISTSPITTASSIYFDPYDPIAPKYLWSSFPHYRIFYARQVQHAPTQSITITRLHPPPNY